MLQQSSVDWVSGQDKWQDLPFCMSPKLEKPLALVQWHAIKRPFCGRDHSTQQDWCLRQGSQRAQVRSASVTIPEEWWNYPANYLSFATKNMLHWPGAFIFTIDLLHLEAFKLLRLLAWRDSVVQSCCWPAWQQSRALAMRGSSARSSGNTWSLGWLMGLVFIQRHGSLRLLGLSQEMKRWMESEAKTACNKAELYIICN